MNSAHLLNKGFFFFHLYHSIINAPLSIFMYVEKFFHINSSTFSNKIDIIVFVSHFSIYPLVQLTPFMLLIVVCCYMYSTLSVVVSQRKLTHKTYIISKFEVQNLNIPSCFFMQFLLFISFMFPSISLLSVGLITVCSIAFM